MEGGIKNRPDDPLRLLITFLVQPTGITGPGPVEGGHENKPYDPRSLTVLTFLNCLPEELGLGLGIGGGGGHENRPAGSHRLLVLSCTAYQKA